MENSWKNFKSPFQKSTSFTTIKIGNYRVLKIIEDTLHDLGQHCLHLLVATLANRRNGHERRVAVLPVLVVEHGRDVLDDVGKHCFASQPTSQTVQRRLGHHRITEIIVIQGINLLLFLTKMNFFFWWNLKL
jgi:hypothetical protein